MMTLNKKAIFCIVTFFLLAMTVSAYAAPNYPSRAISLIVPYAAGGSSDLSARPFADELKNILNEPVVVVNRPGAGGGIGAAEVSRSKGDGYTILNGSIGNITIVPYTANVGYDYKSFKPVAQITDIPLALAVHADSSINSLEEYVNYAKSNPGKLRYGSPGAGNIQHVTLAGWAYDNNLDIVHTPYEGANPAVAALLGGHVESTFTGLTEVSPHVKSGVVKILAITGDKRIEGLDVPTFKECGYEISGSVWYGILAPVQTPDEIVAILADACKKAYDTEKVQDSWEKLYVYPSFLGPKEFSERIEREAQHHQVVLENLGLLRKK